MRSVALSVQKWPPQASSPLRRAQETAAPLAEATGIEAVTLDALAEIEVGATSLSQAEVDRYFVETMQRPLNEHWDGWPEGETFRAFHERVVQGAADILARHEIIPERMHDFPVWHMPPDLRLSIAVVAHGGTNAVLLTHLLDVRPVPWEWLRFESAPHFPCVRRAPSVSRDTCGRSRTSRRSIPYGAPASADSPCSRGDGTTTAPFQQLPEEALRPTAARRQRASS